MYIINNIFRFKFITIFIINLFYLDFVYNNKKQKSALNKNVNFNINNKQDIESSKDNPKVIINNKTNTQTKLNSNKEIDEPSINIENKQNTYKFNKVITDEVKDTKINHDDNNNNNISYNSEKSNIANNDVENISTNHKYTSTTYSDNKEIVTDSNQNDKTQLNNTKELNEDVEFTNVIDDEFDEEGDLENILDNETKNTDKKLSSSEDTKHININTDKSKIDLNSINKNKVSRIIDISFDLDEKDIQNKKEKINEGNNVYNTKINNKNNEKDNNNAEDKNKKNNNNRIYNANAAYISAYEKAKNIKNNNENINNNNNNNDIEIDVDVDVDVDINNTLKNKNYVKQISINNEIEDDPLNNYKQTSIINISDMLEDWRIILDYISLEDIINYHNMIKKHLPYPYDILSTIILGMAFGLLIKLTSNILGLLFCCGSNKV